MDLNTAWFVLVIILFAGYAVLDGFDLGVGILHLFARDEKERRMFMGAIAPVWDGNEVWLVAAGGALFAAFPKVYATVLSACYIPVMFILFALIFRAVSLEFRSKVESRLWRSFWDGSFRVGSFVAAFLFGMVAWSVIHGIPIDDKGIFQGAVSALLNWNSVLAGFLVVAVFGLHGALYLSMKTDGAVSERLRKWALGLWAIVFVLFAKIVALHVSVGWFGRSLSWLLIPLLGVSVCYVPIAIRREKGLQAFLASSVMIVSTVGLVGLESFPRMVPSTIDPLYDLTVFNASSSALTLSVMLVVALIGMPMVIGYTVYVYRVFKGKMKESGENY